MPKPSLTKKMKPKPVKAWALVTYTGTVGEIMDVFIPVTEDYKPTKNQFSFTSYRRTDKIIPVIIKSL